MGGGAGGRGSETVRFCISAVGLGRSQRSRPGKKIKICSSKTTPVRFGEGLNITNHSTVAVERVDELQLSCRRGLTCQCFAGLWC